MNKWINKLKSIQNNTPVYIGDINISSGSISFGDTLFIKEQVNCLKINKMKNGLFQVCAETREKKGELFIYRLEIRANNRKHMNSILIGTLKIVSNTISFIDTDSVGEIKEKHIRTIEEMEKKSGYRIVNNRIGNNNLLSMSKLLNTEEGYRVYQDLNEGELIKLRIEWCEQL